MIDAKKVKIGDFVVPLRDFNTQGGHNYFTILANKKYLIRNIIKLDGESILVQCQCENKRQLYEIAISEFNEDYLNRNFKFTNVADERAKKIKQIFG